MVIHDDVGESIAYRTVTRTGLMRVDEGKAWGVCETLRWAAPTYGGDR